MNEYYDKVTLILKQAGFSIIRQGKGSHQIWGTEKLS